MRWFSPYPACEERSARDLQAQDWQHCLCVLRFQFQRSERFKSPEKVAQVFILKQLGDFLYKEIHRKEGRVKERNCSKENLHIPKVYWVGLHNRLNILHNGYVFDYVNSI